MQSFSCALHVPGRSSNVCRHVHTPPQIVLDTDQVEPCVDTHRAYDTLRSCVTQSFAIISLTWR
jgi:hypothetical protein